MGCRRTGRNKNGLALWTANFFAHELGLHVQRSLAVRAANKDGHFEAPKPNCLNTVRRGSFVQVTSSVQLQTLPMHRWKHIRGVKEIPILPYESSLRNQNQAIESISVVELAQKQRFVLCELDGRQSRFGLVEWTTESLEEFVC